MNNGIQILIYALLVYLLVKSFINQRKYRRIKGLNDCLEIIDNEDEFFTKIDAFIEQAKDEELKSRAETIKLYGIIIHQRYDEFDEVLNQINIDSFIKKERGSVSIQEEEVPFFYLCLIFPCLLWADNHNDQRMKINEKLQPYADTLKSQMVYQISLAFNDFYDNKGDKGQAFDEKIMEGDYGEYDYSKAMIGLYKDLVNSMLTKIYLDEGNQEKYQESMEMTKSFSETHIGRRWVNALHIEIEEDKPSEDEDSSKDEEQ